MKLNYWFLGCFLVFPFVKTESWNHHPPNLFSKTLSGTWTWSHMHHDRDDPLVKKQKDLVSSMVDHMNIDISSPDNTTLTCRVSFHGAHIEGHGSFTPVSSDNEWSLVFHPIHLRRPPRPHGRFFHRLMNMIPFIYRLQKHGLTVGIDKIYYKKPYVYMNVCTTAGQSKKYTLVLKKYQIYHDHSLDDDTHEDADAHEKKKAPFSDGFLFRDDM